MVGNREGAVSYVEEVRYLMRLTTCVREDDVLGYARDRIDGLEDSYFLASVKVVVSVPLG
jgi:hypothetical protein